MVADGGKGTEVCEERIDVCGGLDDGKDVKAGRQEIGAGCGLELVVAGTRVDSINGKEFSWKRT
jgi:hypothetical protein